MRSVPLSLLRYTFAGIVVTGIPIQPRICGGTFWGNIATETARPCVYLQRGGFPTSK